jgi:hypothetical protein
MSPNHICLMADFSFYVRPPPHLAETLIKWRVSIGNPFWSSAILCKHNLAQSRKEMNLTIKQDKMPTQVGVTPAYERKLIRETRLAAWHIF